MSITNTSRSRHAGLLASVAIALGGLASPGAYAQPNDAADDQIIVTGSRIRQDPLNVGEQTHNVSEEDIDKTGIVSIGDLLQRLPYSGGTFNSRFNNSGNFGFPPDGGGIGGGSTQADLRFLGPKRVLVLVDGKRWVNESSASGVSSAVDLNTIPKSIIDHIEVLPDGASPIYGSDAIAGVINIITKRSLEGFEASAYMGAFDEGDGETQEYNLSFGASSDATDVVFDVSYVRIDNVRASDRAISAFPTPGVGSCTPFCSSGTPQGRFVFADPRIDLDMDMMPDVIDVTLNNGVINNGVMLPFYDITSPGVGDDFHAFGTPDRFNFSQFNFVQTPSERLSLFSQAIHEITPDIRIEVKALYNNRKSVNQAAPEPLFIGPDAGNGNLLDTIGVDVTNPFNPFGISLDAGPGGNFIFAGRRPLEAGPRIFEQNVDTWYVSGGLVGEFDVGDRDFYWDATVIFSESQANQIKHGAFNSAKLKQALGPLDQCIDPMTMQSINGCVPFNYFGGQGTGNGSITQAMLDFVGFVQKDESQQELFDVTANLTGDLFELPAGPVGFAVGYEHRTRKGSFQPDAVVIAGESAGVPSTPTAGQFTVDEVYGEVSVPILSEQPFFDLLEFSGAVRYSDYSTFGGETTFKVSGKWRPHPDVLLRGSFTEGLRAPGIGELFGSIARFDQTIQDPCSDMLGLSGGPIASATTQANCIATGVPGSGSYVQFNQQISVQTGGNPNLAPEESDSYSAGIVYSPSWLEGSGLIEVNYYNIDLTGPIQAVNAQEQLNACILTLDPTLCGGISRTAGGVINSFANQLTNIGSIETSGFDFRIEYQPPETGIGEFRFNLLATYLKEYTEMVPSGSGFQTIVREGTEIGDPERGFPEWQGTFTVDWFWENFFASFTLRYVDAITETCPSSLFGVVVNGMDLSTLCSSPATGFNQLDSRVYGDFQVRYTPPFLEERTALTLGLNNVFDTDPPNCLSCALNGFDATLYDVPGIFGYFKVDVRF